MHIFTDLRTQKVNPMTPWQNRVTDLSRRMADDMKLRNYSQRTIDAYTYHVGKFAEFLGKSPLEATPENVTYFQFVFTIPDKLSSLAPGNREAIYHLVFRSAWKTLRDVIDDEQQFETAAVMVLHTWNQKLEAHAHVHALVPGGGPSLIGDRRWIKSRRVGKGVRTQLPERPAGCCAQLSPDPVSNTVSDADAIDDGTPCCPHCAAKMRWIGFERKESWRIIMHSCLRPHWYRDD